MIVLDTETTGLNPRKNSIVSIGAVDFFNPSNQFYAECRIWEGAVVDQFALQVNGFTLTQVTDAEKQTVGEAIAKFLAWVKPITDKTIAGQNTSFDRDFLMVAARKFGINWDIGHRTIDLHSICYAHYLKHRTCPPTKDGKTSLSLDAILNYVGLPAEPVPHIALNGAKLEAECFSRLIFNKPLLEEYKSHPLPNYF